MGASAPTYLKENGMGQVPMEEYFEQLRKSDPMYHWPLERSEERKAERQKIHEEFPYVINYSGHYGPDCLLDDISDWCHEKFGSKHGKCYWHGCEWNWDRWHAESGLEDELDNELHENRGPRPDSKDKKAWKIWQEEGSQIIDKHFEMLETRLDAPDKHSHWGVWTSFFITKTGYDYGYEDFCFKNHEDAVYFKLMWAEEAEQRA